MGFITGIFAAPRAITFVAGSATNPDDGATKNAAANKYLDMFASSLKLYDVLTKRRTSAYINLIHFESKTNSVNSSTQFQKRLFPPLASPF